MRCVHFDNLPTEHSMQQDLQSDLSIDHNIEAKADVEVAQSAPIELTASFLKLVAGGTSTQSPNGTW